MKNWTFEYSDDLNGVYYLLVHLYMLSVAPTI